MQARSSLGWSILAALSLGSTGQALAQSQILPSLFPEGVPGYDTAAGVTVQSRLHPEFAPAGLRYGALQVFPTLDESLGYNSNVVPGASTGTNRAGSWQITTAPALILGSAWSRNQLGAAVNLQNTQYLSQASQSQTNATISAGGRLDVGEDELTVAAAHLSLHQNQAAVNAIASSTPIAFQVNDLRAAYTIVDGRWRLTPALEGSTWNYGDATVFGQPISQAYQDRIVGQGSVTLRYEWAPLRNVIFIARALGQNYTNIPVGQPTSNSHSYQALAGFDYDDNAVWRWRLLIGAEARQFTASAYQRQNTFISEGEVTWFPTGLTTVHATLSRDTEDAAQEGVSGLIYSAARLTVDHEYMRNLLLRASAGLQQAAYFQGGRQTGYTAGIGMTWMLNRWVRISLTYDQTSLRGGGQSGSQPLATSYNQSISLLTFHFGL